MSKISKMLHLKGLHFYFNMFLVNKVYAGSNQKHFEKKRRLLNAIGHKIGEGTKVVGPLECTGNLNVGRNCWIGKNFKVNGNGSVTIGDNCDIGPEVTFQTGGHEVGGKDRRAGKGMICQQTIGSGTWIGGRSTILKNTNVGNSCVIAGCACVIKDVAENSLVGGVPARVIRVLDNDT